MKKRPADLSLAGWLRELTLFVAAALVAAALMANTAGGTHALAEPCSTLGGAHGIIADTQQTCGVADERSGKFSRVRDDHTDRSPDAA